MESSEGYSTDIPDFATHISYAQAGVDIAAGKRAVEMYLPHVKRTTRPEVLAGVGGFAGLFELGDKYRQPVLSAATDGVGTKLAIAQALDIHDTVGIDLVAMVVDDLVVTGAEPLFLLDYVATGKVIPEQLAQLVKGIADGCIFAGCSLLGGETAEHPGIMRAGEYDLSATAVGIVEKYEILGAERVLPGDIVIALASSGLHSNGYSMVRKVLLADAKLDLNVYLDEFGRTLGEELLIPTRIYVQDCLTLIRETRVHAFAHITGGGLADNISRVIPAGLMAKIDRNTWCPWPIFRFIAEIGQVPQVEMEHTFNMGVGMVAIIAPEDVDRALAVLTARHMGAWVIGYIQARQDGQEPVELIGNHLSF